MAHFSISIYSKLVFSFEELENDFENDYIFGKTKRNNAWQLFKFKLKSLISTKNGNSITWDGGLFLNISQIINNLKDKVGGFVSTETFNKTIENQNTSINNVGKENQEIIQNAHDELTKATTNAAIYSKKLPSISANNSQVDILKGDTLQNIINKIQCWINRFKYATGISLSGDFSSTTKGKVNNNDTVESAISKLQNQISTLRQSLPTDWMPNAQSHINIEAGDSYDDAIGKIEADRRLINNLEQAQGTVELMGNTTDSVIDKLAYRISNGILEIVIPKFEKLEWMYTRTLVSDNTRVFLLNFSDDIFNNKIAPNLFIPEGDWSQTNACRLLPLTTISLAKHMVTSNWEAPNYDVKALVSLAYIRWRDENNVTKAGIGLSLTPISKMKMQDGNLLISEVSDSSTFQDLVESTDVRYYIPPMLIRYNLR